MAVRPNYAAMTTNERLATAGLLEDWDVAIRARDRDRAIALLQEVEVGDRSAWVVDTVLANPAFYGF